MSKLTENTLIPISLLITIIGVVTWAVTNVSRAEAKNVEQDDRLNRQSAYIQKMDSDYKAMLIEIRDRGIRTEEAVNIILKRNR